MRKLFLFAALFMLAATSCDSVANTPNDADNESRATEDIMDMLINDLLMGVCVPRGCEVMEGDKCIKAWDEAVFGTVGAKFYDFGLNDMAFYNDGTCRLGYTSSLYSNCEERLKDIENHPRGLYDTWQWSCNKAESTITITAEDLAKQNKDPKTTIKIVSYKDGILMIDGELPNMCIKNYTYKYKFEIQGAEARAEFEKEYFNEEDYPCCAQ